MNWGITAMILIVLDEREGQWLTLDALQTRLKCPPGALLERLEHLWAEGMLALQRDADGEVVSASTPTRKVAFAPGA